MKGAPLAIIALLLVGSAIGFFITSMRFQGKVDSLEDRLKGKDDMLAFYRSKAERLDALTATAVKETNAEVRTRALALAADIRAMADRYRQQLESVELALRRSASDQEWQTNAHASTNVFANLHGEYNKRFKADALTLRDEIVSRLPPEKKPAGKDAAWDQAAFENAVNTLALDQVATVLEVLAKKLP